MIVFLYIMVIYLIDWCNVFVFFCKFLNELYIIFVKMIKGVSRYYKCIYLKVWWVKVNLCYKFVMEICC